MASLSIIYHFTESRSGPRQDSLLTHSLADSLYKCLLSATMCQELSDGLEVKKMRSSRASLIFISELDRSYT